MKKVIKNVHGVSMRGIMLDEGENAPQGYVNDGSGFYYMPSMYQTPEGQAKEDALPEAKPEAPKEEPKEEAKPEEKPAEEEKKEEAGGEESGEASEEKKPEEPPVVKAEAPENTEAKQS